MTLVPVNRNRQRVARRTIPRPWWVGASAPDVVPSTVIDTRRGQSLIASAQRIISTKLQGVTRQKAEAWMVEAWAMFDLVGELHFLATTLARRAARARFYIGMVNGNVVDELEFTPGQPIPPAQRNAAKAKGLFDSLGDGFIGIQEIVERAFVNQFIVGAAYLVGAPQEVWDLARPLPSGQVRPLIRPIDSVPVGELVWKTLSVTELAQVEGGYELRQRGSQALNGGVSTMLPGRSVYVITLWQSHPMDASVPDSPVRATLPVLRELVGLTQHVSAQIDSRLAGAGVLLMRSSASRAIKKSLGLAEDDPRDPFTDLLIDAMVTPISERDSAAAVVPLVVTIPDESTKPEYINFSAPLDQFASALRDEAIRRISLSLDAPPELLLGQGDANHWSAWLTAQEVVDAHIAPTLGLIARGLTTEFLRPILVANGISVAEAQTYAIWFDTSDLVVQANQGADAQVLYGLGLLSDESTRRANGFDEADAPKKDDNHQAAIDIVKGVFITNPGLMNRPGLDVLTDQVEALLNGHPQSGLAATQQAIAGSGSGQIATPSGGAAPSAPTPGVTAGPGTSAPGSSPSVPAGPGQQQGVPQTRVPAAVLPARVREFAAQRYGTHFGSWDRT